MQQAEAAGYQPGGAEHYRRLALALKQRTPHAADLRRLADAPAADGEAAARNALRAAVEVAARLLPPPEALALLLEWVRQGRVQSDETVRGFVGRHLLRLALLSPRVPPTPATCLMSPAYCSDPTRSWDWCATGSASARSPWRTEARRPP